MSRIDSEKETRGWQNLMVDNMKKKVIAELDKGIKEDLEELWKRPLVGKKYRKKVVKAIAGD